MMSHIFLSTSDFFVLFCFFKVHGLPCKVFPCICKYFIILFWNLVFFCAWNSLTQRLLGFHLPFIPRLAFNCVTAVLVRVNFLHEMSCSNPVIHQRSFSQSFVVLCFGFVLMKFKIHYNNILSFFFIYFFILKNTLFYYIFLSLLLSLLISIQLFSFFVKMRHNRDKLETS